MKVGDWEKVLLDATERVFQQVSESARRGGGGRSLGIGASGDRTIVADKMAEDEILRALSGRKDLLVLSEEAGAIGRPKAQTLVVVDPLDGSSNYEKGIPFYCTSVAVVEGRTAADVVLGVVRDLVTGDVYTARKGGGATKNGREIRTSGVSSTSDAVVGVDLSRGPSSLASRLAPLVSGVKRQVHFGANALEMCYVAEGRTDSFVDLSGRIRVTDLAAAYLIAIEAGAKVTDGRGEALRLYFDLSHRFSFVASANARLHREMLALVGGVGRGERGRD